MARPDRELDWPADTSFHSGLIDEYVADKGAVLRGRDWSDAAGEKPAQASS